MNITEKVKLSFIPKNKGTAETKFDLYDDQNTQLNGELQLVDEWSKHINNCLKNNN